MKTKLMISFIAVSMVAAIGINYQWTPNNSSELELKYLLAGDIEAHAHEEYYYGGDSCSQRNVPHPYTLHFAKRNKKWNCNISLVNISGNDGGGSVGAGGENSGGDTFDMGPVNCIQTECIPWPRTMPGKYCQNDCPIKCMEEAVAAKNLWISSH